MILENMFVLLDMKGGSIDLYPAELVELALLEDEFLGTDGKIYIPDSLQESLIEVKR